MRTIEFILNRNMPLVLAMLLISGSVFTIQAEISQSKSQERHDILAKTPPMGKRLNVLFIAIDDLNDWVGCFGGNPQVKTPHLDRLNVDGGLVMMNAHTPATVCCPSRSALLTGVHAHRTGVYGNRHNLRHAPKARDLVTLPQYFSRHGYHSVSSQCGSADVLKALGIKTELFPDQFYHIFQTVGLAFIFAPRYKPSPRNFAGIRQSLGARTIINILDPLTKPALTKRHLIGVYDQKLSMLVAQVLQEFGIFSAMVVSGENGLDEMNICGKTYVVEISGTSIEEYEITPEELGLKRWSIDTLKGGSAAVNKRMTQKILEGEKGGPRDVTILNAAAALKVSGIVKNLEAGIKKAIHSIDSRAALNKLNQMISISSKLD